MSTDLTKDPHFIKALFRSISPTYDTANDVISLGMARLWRRQLVQWTDLSANSKVLDCATGTGDLAFEYSRKLGSKATVVGTDFVEEMLNIARAKIPQGQDNITFQWADAMDLPFSDAEFDAASIAYGIRNVADPVKALGEMARVVKAGGKVMVLETGKIQTPLLRPLIRLYFEKWVPLMGGAVSGNRSAYEYLNRSSNSFPCGQEFISLMMSTGRFAQVEFKSLMGGASYIYKGVVKN